ncbi:MAG: aminopeptidase [Parachlamydiales bacterium]|jgi:aminopeptidase
MEFEQFLDNYANLIVTYALNVQPGQTVYINGELIHRDFIFRCAKAAYNKGAKYVGVDFTDPYLSRLRLLETRDEEHLKFTPDYITKKFDDLVDNNDAILRILGSEAPDVLVDVDPKTVNTLNFSYRNYIRRFYEDGIGRSQIQWTLAAAATPAWAKKIFPQLSDADALNALWMHIIKICRADKANCVDLWLNHNQRLKDRAAALTDLKIKELHFEGPDTDLKVGLTPLAIFRGGGDKSTRGISFEPNVPTEECFTTPDWRKTEGFAKITRPFVLNGVLVEGLKMQFKNGELVDCSAKQGLKAFQEYTSSDEGAKRLGEVALVGIDSPVYESGVLFRETLFDENAACHIAFGMAYKFCLDGGTKMTPEEVDSNGCNVSNVHSDVMISSEEVDVTATTYNGERIVLISKGNWVE